MDPDQTIVREIMSSPVRSVEGQLTVVEVARILCDERIGSVVIHARDDGIVTDTDVVRAVRDGCDPTTTMLSEIMTTPVLTVEPDESVRQAAETMDAEGIKKLLVEAETGYAGIVTTTDIVAGLSPEFEDVIDMFAAP
jgi:CBS domain-containing protein